MDHEETQAKGLLCVSFLTFVGQLWHTHNRHYKLYWKYIFGPNHCIFAPTMKNKLCSKQYIAINSLLASSESKLVLPMYCTWIGGTLCASSSSPFKESLVETFQLAQNQTIIFIFFFFFLKIMEDPFQKLIFSYQLYCIMELVQSCIA